ncbi:hypothetical protein SCHPADRAFT_897352, partial [Schizopora paradoxa]
REHRTEEIVESKALCRLALGIKEVVIVRKYINGRPPSHIHILLNGDVVTPRRFLFSAGQGEQRNPLDVIEHDIDGNVRNNTIQCTACSREFRIRRADQGTVALDTWAEHKFTCSKLQLNHRTVLRQRYEREVNTTSRADPRRKRARREQHGGPATRVRNATSSRSRVTVAEPDHEGTDMPSVSRGPGPLTNAGTSNGSNTGMSNKSDTKTSKRPRRRSESTSGSESEPSNVKCTKRHVYNSGEIDEVEVGFPSEFAGAHLNFVAKIINNFKSTTDEEIE